MSGVAEVHVALRPLRYVAKKIFIVVSARTELVFNDVLNKTTRKDVDSR